MRNRACVNYGHWRVISLSPERGTRYFDRSLSTAEIDAARKHPVEPAELKLHDCVMLNARNSETVSCIEPVHYPQLTTALVQLTGASSARCSFVCLGAGAAHKSQILATPRCGSPNSLIYKMEMSALKKLFHCVAPPRPKCAHSQRARVRCDIGLVSWRWAARRGSASATRSSACRPATLRCDRRSRGGRASSPDTDPR
jgi:hypothetical protein